jgi:hypothetical protein
LIDWSRKFGKKKEDALTYYVKKYGIVVDPDAPKTEVAKHVFTSLLDNWLSNILLEIDRKLGTNLFQSYLSYKDQNGLEGPINDVRRIRNGKWEGDPPPDGVMYSPLKYVMKYLTKVMRMVLKGEKPKEEHQAKLYGYWLYGKRFNSYSPSLRPEDPNKEQTDEPEWKFVGVFYEDELTDELIHQVLASPGAGGGGVRAEAEVES